MKSLRRTDMAAAIPFVPGSASRESIEIGRALEGDKVRSRTRDMLLILPAVCHRTSCPRSARAAASGNMGLTWPIAGMVLNMNFGTMVYREC